MGVLIWSLSGRLLAWVYIKPFQFLLKPFAFLLRKIFYKKGKNHLFTVLLLIAGLKFSLKSWAGLCQCRIAYEFNAHLTRVETIPPTSPAQPKSLRTATTPTRPRFYRLI